MEYFYGYPQPQQWIRTSEEEEKAKECVWANRGKARTNTHARGLPVHRGRGVVSNNHRNITSNFCASEETSGSKTVIEYSKVALLK